MKHICKICEPEKFQKWKAEHPVATYNDLSCGGASVVKKLLKQSLLAEQKYLCCYCECRIDETNSHIEHFRPKGLVKYADLQLDYTNLFASCTKVPTGTQDEHCGHKKRNLFSEKLVSPLEFDCSGHFKFFLDGKIASTDERGRETIDLLHLDSELLNQKRRNLIDYFLEFDGADLDMELKEHLDEAKPCIGEFFTMVTYLHSRDFL